MTRDEFNTFCGAMKATSHVVQWGNSDVWKVGGKLFAVAGWNDGRDAYTFKVTEMIYEIMQNAPGFRPAPYLASRGMTWLQIHAPEQVARAEIEQHLTVSYELVAAKLTKKARAELGIVL